MSTQQARSGSAACEACRNGGDPRWVGRRDSGELREVLRVWLEREIRPIFPRASSQEGLERISDIGATVDYDLVVSNGVHAGIEVHARCRSDVVKVSLFESEVEDKLEEKHAPGFLVAEEVIRLLNDRPVRCVCRRRPRAFV